eukprot:gene11133-18753_t
MGKKKASRSPEADMLPPDLLTFWSSVTAAPGSIFLDENQENMRENLRSTAELLLRYQDPKDRNQAFVAGIQFLSDATCDVQNLVARCKHEDGSYSKDSEVEPGSLLLRSVETVQAISDLIAAAHVCSSAFIIRNCLRWLQPTVMAVEQRDPGRGTRPSLRVCEGTNLAHTCMDLLEWREELVKFRELDVLLFQTLGIMGLNKELARQVEDHPQYLYFQCLALPKAITPPPSRRLQGLALEAGISHIWRSRICKESPAHGDDDFDSLQELAWKAEYTKNMWMAVPPLSFLQ